jgi:hypothetical protein
VILCKAFFEVKTNVSEVKFSVLPIFGEKFLIGRHLEFISRRFSKKKLSKKVNLQKRTKNWEVFHRFLKWRRFSKWLKNRFFDHNSVSFEPFLNSGFLIVF